MHTTLSLPSDNVTSFNKSWSCVQSALRSSLSCLVNWLSHWPLLKAWATSISGLEVIWNNLWNGTFRGQSPSSRAKILFVGHSYVPARQHRRGWRTSRISEQPPHASLAERAHHRLQSSRWTSWEITARTDAATILNRTFLPSSPRRTSGGTLPQATRWRRLNAPVHLGPLTFKGKLVS